ncbi:MAG: hypothetical protein NVS2B6_09850 [Thermoleophilaceae bacterium]
MERRVRQAIEGRGLTAAFQPIADLATGRVVVGLQALARFEGPPRQSPDRWFADAREIDPELELDLELAAVRAALAGLSLLPGGAFFSINVEPELATSGRLTGEIPLERGDRVVLEVTNHARLGDYQALAAALAPLRQRGVRVAVDDSRAGISSLQEIALLAPCFLKLDRSLTRDIDNDPTRRALASALLALASPIGSTVIAEGVETRAELVALRALGIGHGQGYLLGRPLSAQDCDPDVVQLDLGGCDDGVARSTSERGTGGRAILRERRLHSFRDAVVMSFHALEEQLPPGVLTLTQFDYPTRLTRIVNSRAPDGTGISAGLMSRTADSACYIMAGGRGPRLCGDIPSEPAYAALPIPSELGHAELCRRPARGRRRHADRLARHHVGPA